MEWEIVNYEEDRSEYLGQKKKKIAVFPHSFPCILENKIFTEYLTGESVECELLIQCYGQKS